MNFGFFHCMIYHFIPKNSIVDLFDNLSVHITECTNCFAHRIDGEDAAFRMVRKSFTREETLH
ncbi:MAG: hypothetical protein ACTTKL_05900 [Treponema sp.]